MMNYLFCFETKYPNYFVNEQGDVFSTKSGDIKKLKTAMGGRYLSVVIWNNHKRKVMSVHRLVAETFIPNPDNRPEVNHKNGIKWDNRVENLEWVTKSENMNHAILNGLSNSIGETHYGAKLTEEQVIQIRELYATKKYTQRQLGKMYGVCFQHISKIVNNKQWKHI